MWAPDNGQGTLLEADFWETVRSFVLNLRRQVDETLHETPDLMQGTEPTLWGLPISRGDQDTSLKEPQSDGRDTYPALGDLIS